MAGIYLLTSRGYLTSDLNIASALRAKGGLLGSQKLAESKKNIPCYILEGTDVETKESVTVFISQVDSHEATEKIKKFGYKLVGIFQPTIAPIIVFEILPPPNEKAEILETWVRQWFRGQLDVNAKAMAEHRRDLSVMAHHIEIMKVKDVPEELRDGGGK